MFTLTRTHIIQYIVHSTRSNFQAVGAVIDLITEVVENLSDR